MPNPARYLWPRSLYGQILLVVALALLVAQSINAYMLLSGARGRAVVEASTMVVSRVVSQMERAREFNLPIDHRTRKLDADGKPSRFRQANMPVIVRAAPLTIADFHEQVDMTARANEYLSQANAGLSQTQLSLGPISALPDPLRRQLMRKPKVVRMDRVQRDSPHEAVLLSGRLNDGRWVVAAARVRPNDGGSRWALLLQTLTLYIAVMIPLALVARRIARPLVRLTERVQRVGLADEIEPMKSEGPNDVRQLIDSFNIMQARVSTLLGEKDVMLGAIGHDLKTPLAALRVRVESVEDDEDREKMADTIDEMVTILDDILALARLGKSGEAVQSVDIGALVESIASESEGASFDAPAQRIVASIRPVLIRRALRNLIGNAVTYGNAAHVSVRQEADRVCVDISDSGPGIDPALVESMFEPFTRAEKSRSRATGGSGLGLTISRAIARAHGGDVVLENRSEGGLKATLSFKA